MNSLMDRIQRVTICWKNLSDVFNQERMIRHVVIMSFAIILCVVCLSINRGIGFHDESRDLVLLRDHIAINSSAWPLFFSWLPNNLLEIRMVTVGLLFAGSLFFGYGMYSYFKVRFNLPKTSILLLSMFAFIGAFCLGNLVCLVPNYYWFNHFIFASGIGLALLSTNSGKVGIWWAWLSGFFLGFLLFIMPSNTPIILFVAAFIILHTNPWQRLIGFVVGVICAIVVFTLMIQSLAEFYLMIKQTLGSNTGHSSTHGIRQMISWSINTVIYIITNIALITILIYFVRRQMDEINIKRELLSIWVLLLIIVYFSIPYIMGLLKGVPNGVYPAEILAAMFGWFILETRHKLTLQEGSAFALLFVAPIFASLGTDVPFSIRGTMYMGTFYGSAGLLFVLSPICARFRIYMCLVLALLTFGFVTNFFRPNWSTGGSLSENIIPLSEIGIQKGVRVTPDMITMINEARNVIGLSKNVVVGDVHAWGFVYLLDLQPLTYEWKPPESQILKAIENSGMRELVFIESSQNLFSASFWSEISTKWKIENVRVLDGQFKFYRLSRVS
jgi:hypothetical protein